MLFEVPTLAALSEEDIMRHLRDPITGTIERKDGGALEDFMPQKQVSPSAFRMVADRVKLADFGNGEVTLVHTVNSGPN